MSCCHCLSLFSSPMSLAFSSYHHCHFRFLVTSAVRRHHRRRLLKHSPHTPTTIFKLSDDALQITLKPPTDSIQHLESRLHHFIDYGREVYHDLRTLVSVNQESGRVVVSCRRSTLEFLGAVLLSSFLLVVAFRVFFKLERSQGEVLVYKRDRSLGGKVVAVGSGEMNRQGRGRITSPLSLDNESSYRERRINRTERRREQELPRWWPRNVKWTGSEISNKEDYQRLADKFIQAIVDQKIKGQDVSPNDIVQLRHVCKTYGVTASTSTENARDSLYRESINFLLSYCESISNLSTSIQINGEGAREFIAGLAENIGLESSRAARMVSAAVAARTRSKILQAWALEVQNKHSEAIAELFKVCIFHKLFPPEESSPEMEMVARGLEKSLTVEQRASILNSFIAVCGKEDVDQSLVEALGLERVHETQPMAKGE